MIKYEDNKRNHVVIPGREKELDKFLKSTYKGVNHKIENSFSSNSEDAITWSCFDIISQLSLSKKVVALDEIIEHSFSDDDMNPKLFSFSDEEDIKIEIGKTYKGKSISEETEVDASIITSNKVFFIEAKLYSSISLADKLNKKPYDQIAKKIRVGLDFSLNEKKEFKTLKEEIKSYFNSEEGQKKMNSINNQVKEQKETATGTSLIIGDEVRSKIEFAEEGVEYNEKDIFVMLNNV
ncbi:MAG TPA: hypothetical protein PK855_05410, partial [Bacteroidales bacterium]|nr:hypothetical protein [Bacteroidales bacterium]